MIVQAIDKIGQRCQFEIVHARGIGMKIKTPKGDEYFVTRESLERALEETTDAKIPTAEPDPRKYPAP
jgi:hypothetical protein